MTTSEITAINEKVKRESSFIEAVLLETQKVIVGQKYLLERLIVGLLANGHILLEGVPGLAKTTAVKTIAATIRTKCQRLQFTPDMLPADLTGTLIYDQKESDFKVKKGPIFANIILADEINRAQSKVQSALLEAMQEKQVTIGENTFPLPNPFLVLATQNPIEQEGTYPVPEAQVDRFMLKLIVRYPTKKEEKEILERMAMGKEIEVKHVIGPEQILELRKLMHQIYVDDKVKDYILDL